MELLLVGCPNCEAVIGVAAQEAKHTCECGQEFEIRADLNIETEIE